MHLCLPKTKVITESICLGETTSFSCIKWNKERQEITKVSYSRQYYL